MPNGPPSDVGLCHFGICTAESNPGRLTVVLERVLERQCVDRTVPNIPMVSDVAAVHAGTCAVVPRQMLPPPTMTANSSRARPSNVRSRRPAVPLRGVDVGPRPKSQCLPGHFSHDAMSMAHRQLSRRRRPGRTPSPWQDPAAWRWSAFVLTKAGRGAPAPCTNHPVALTIFGRAASASLRCGRSSRRSRARATSLGTSSREM